MFNETFIENMKNPFILMNLARGKVVQTTDLVSGLKNDKIRGACLDVHEFEKKSFESFFEQHMPEEFSFLTQSERVILTPHIAGWTEESYYKLSNVLADKILEYHSPQ